MAANISTLLQNLNNGADLLPTLQGIQAILTTTPQSELNELLKNVSFDPVFSCLNSTNRNELELSRDILTKLLDNVEVDVMLAQFRDELCMGLGHPQEDIRTLCLRQISRAGSNPQGMDILLSDPDLVSLLISKVGDDNLGVAKVAMAVLQVLGSNVKGQELLMGGQQVESLRRVMEKSDIVRYRVFEVVVGIAASSPEGLERVSSAGFFQGLVSDLNSDDILIQLNAIEMLAGLVPSQHALGFLDGQGVLGRLQNLLIGAQADPSQDFLIPAIVKFFGVAAHFEPKEIVEKQPAFLRVTFDLLSSNDPAHLCVAVETVGFVGRTVEGKQTLDKQGQAMNDALKQIGRLLVQPPTETRIRALTATQDLFTLKEDQQTDDLLNTQERWFSSLAANPLELVLSLCKQPFMEIRCGALSVLRALAGQRWAGRMLTAEAGFLEYVLDRSTEPDKVGKESKYEVVKALAEAPHAGEVFEGPALLRLRGYVREGPFYVRVQSEVAMEGS